MELHARRVIIALVQYRWFIIEGPGLLVNFVMYILVNGNENNYSKRYFSAETTDISITKDTVI